ncbi:MAG: methyltransferase [Alcanivorax sp.]|nr:methyltransferase [Alcanivorax sp.]
MTELSHPWGTLALKRWPRRRQEPLQAWDNADRYLLNTLVDRGRGESTLVVNDQHGALWLAASQRGSAKSLGDSWLARQAALVNAADNALSVDEADWLWPGDTPCQPDQVLLRVPKELALLEYQLETLSACLPSGTPLWLAGMDKHLPRQLVTVMQRYLGNGRAELGWKKARLFSAEAPGKRLQASPFPGRVKAGAWQLTVHAGVFAQQQLDIGARLFMAHLPRNLPEGSRVADLGCGNGVIGMTALAQNPQATVIFCDESWLALESARDNVARYFPDRQCHFHLGDGLAGLSERFDAILLNPPFHQGHVVGDQVARRLFRQAHRALAPGGELRVIGNRHLGYHKLLAGLFDKVTQLGGDRKFVVWQCRNQGGD